MGYATPTNVMGPRKRRPPSLLIDSVAAHYDDDAPGRHQSFGYGEEIPVRRTFIDFGSLIGTPPDSPRPTISTAPARMGGLSIRETFETWKIVTTADPASPSGASCTIVAGAPSSTASSTRLTVTTDCSGLHDLEQVKDDEIRGKAKRALLSAAKSGTLEAALKRTLKGADELPDVTYRLSPISMKAAGYWTPPSPTPRTPSTYSSPSWPRSPSSEPYDPSCLLRNDLFKEGFGPVGFIPKPITKPPEGLDAAAWANLYAQFEPPLGWRTASAPRPPAENGGGQAAWVGAEQLSVVSVPSQEAVPPPAQILDVSTPLPPHSHGRVVNRPLPVPSDGRVAAGRALGDQVAEHDADNADSSDDDDSSDEDLGLCPMYSENAPLPSAGSALHGEGTCKRCCFFPKGRCNNGYDCQFCHFAHEKRKPKNKKKKKKRRKNKQASNGQRFGKSPSCAASPQAQSPHSPSVQQVFGGDSRDWERPRDRPSQLVCHGLNYCSPTASLPGAVMPGYPIMSMPVMHQVCDNQVYTWPSHY